MGLAEIVQRIAADAERESAEIIEEGRRQAAEVRRRAEAEATAKRERILADARAQAQRLSDQRLAQARLDARNQVLAAKREALEEVQAAALERLRGLSDDAYRELLARQVAERARGDEAIAVDAADAERLGAAFIALASKLAQGVGKSGAFEAAGETADLGGGGVLLIGDGTEDPITPAGLVAEARRDLEPDIARALFDASRPAAAGTSKTAKPAAREAGPATGSKAKTKVKTPTKAKKGKA